VSNKKPREEMPDGLNGERRSFWLLIEGIQEDVREIRGNQIKLFFAVLTMVLAFGSTVIGFLIAQ